MKVKDELKEIASLAHNVAPCDVPKSISPTQCLEAIIYQQN